DSFALANNSVLDENGQPLVIGYDSSRPGAVSVGSGHYAEIDTWRGSIFLDGDSADLTAGLTTVFDAGPPPRYCDFWKLAVGHNPPDFDTDTVVLWAPAWA